MIVENQKVILASNSPRRRSLLGAVGFELEVISPNADETWPDDDIEKSLVAIARRKLDSVASVDKLTIAADTIVELDGKILGKPSDKQDALHLLKKLSGKCHRVFTGFCVASDGHVVERVVCTKVWFRSLFPFELELYLENAEYLDKAGAYAIQEHAASFIDRIEGSFTNVVGLPVAEVIQAIEEIQ